MPPPNTDSITATIIPSLPYITTQSGIHDAGTTYKVWYKYTPTVETILLGVYFRGDGVIYKPDTRIHINDGLNFIGYINANLISQVPLLVGKTYYFEIIPNSGNPNPATLNINLLAAPQHVSVPGGSIFIRGASITSSWIPLGYKGLGAGYINPNTGVIFNFEPMFVVGESGDFLPSGTILFADDINVLSAVNDKWILYNPDLSIKAQFTWDWAQQTGHPVSRASREYGRFYLGSKGYSGNTTYASWTSVDENGILAPTVVLPGMYGMDALANSADDQFVYIAGTGGGGAPRTIIRRWNKALGAFGPDLVPANSVANSYVADMLVMPNGHVVVIWQEFTLRTCFVRIYDANGAILRNFTPIPNNTTGVPARLGYADDLTSFWLFIHVYNNAGQTSNSYFFNLLESDVSILKTINSPDGYWVEFDHGPNPQYRFVTSDSCPFILILPGGTLIVNKVLNGGSPAQVFHFTTTGGLVPSTFNLASGGSRTFSGVTPGVYGIIETPILGYHTTYSVSNGSPNTAITVAANEVVTVTVTNNGSNPLSGIYKIVPNSFKSNDTVYTDLQANETEDRAIPRPTWKTGLLGG